MYRKHTCKKEPTKISELYQIFNFSDSFFQEDIADYQFDPIKLELSNQNFNFNINHNSDSPTWLNQHLLFAEKNETKFKILRLNIYSINCKFHDIDLLLRKNIYDVFFIQESKLRSITPDTLIINDRYHLIRRDRVSGAGGIIVFVKKIYVISDIFKDEFF